MKKEGTCEYCAADKRIVLIATIIILVPHDVESLSFIDLLTGTPVVP